MNKRKRDTLITAIVRALSPSSAKIKECRDLVIFFIEAAKTRSEFDKKNEHPGMIKRKAKALRASLMKAQMLAKEIEPLFSAALDDAVRYDVRRSYDVFQECLKNSIDVSGAIATRIIVPEGKKPKDYNKYEAKRTAISLIAISLADKFASCVDETDYRQRQNEIASLIYELLTGVRDVDIPESAAAYRPPFLKTRGMIKIQR